MEDIKKSFWILFYLCATNFVFSQFLHKSLVTNPTTNCTLESIMDPQDNMEIWSDAADTKVTFENIKETKFKRDFFQVINSKKKLEKVKESEEVAITIKNAKKSKPPRIVNLVSGLKSKKELVLFSEILFKKYDA